jgi:hypothetical protein
MPRIFILLLQGMHAEVLVSDVAGRHTGTVSEFFPLFPVSSPSSCSIEIHEAQVSPFRANKLSTARPNRCLPR